MRWTSIGLAGLSRRYGTSCTGAADYEEKRIYVSEARATVHEFGHFLDSILGFPSESCSFYEAEAGAASAFLRAYAGDKLPGILRGLFFLLRD